MATPFNDLLRQKLADHCITKVAARIGVRKQLLHSWVHEGRVPTLNHAEAICKLADYLGITLKELITGGRQKHLTVVEPEETDQAA